MASVYDQATFAAAPGAWWKLSDAVGTTVQDFSCLGNIGTATNVTFSQTGPITVMPADTAALFNGTSSTITTSYNPSGSKPSVEALVNIASAVTGVILANSSTARTGGLILGLTSGRPYVTFGNGTAQATASSASAISTGTFHQVAGTWDGTTITLYVDGVSVATASLNGTLAAGQTHLAIGYNPDGATGYFAGTLAEVAYFPSANGAANIAQRFALMTSGTASEWLPPWTFAVGEEATSAALGIIANDLAELATNISAAGVGPSALAGSLTNYSQPAGALIQAGTYSFTYTNGSDSTMTFPNAFPNALITATCTRVGLTTPAEFIVVKASSTVSTLVFRVWTNNNAEAASGSKEMSWVAIGW